MTAIADPSVDVDLEELFDQDSPCTSSSQCARSAEYRWIFTKPCGHPGTHNYCALHHEEMMEKKKLSIFFAWSCMTCGGPSKLVRYFRI